MPDSKRLFDLLISVPFAVLLFPLFVIIAVWIKLDSKGPVFVMQDRIGKDGAPFGIFKFRTMVVDAESRGNQITVGSDPRITRIGHLLRRYKIDELPQLLNVIKGEMSIVGPRPEVPKYVRLYDAAQRRVLSVRPGITSPASIKFSNESDLLGKQPDPENYYIQILIPAKIEEDMGYVDHPGILNDLAIILRTVRKITKHTK